MLSKSLQNNAIVACERAIGQGYCLQSGWEHGHSNRMSVQIRHFVAHNFMQLVGGAGGVARSLNPILSQLVEERIVGLHCSRILPWYHQDVSDVVVYPQVPEHRIAGGWKLADQNHVRGVRHPDGKRVRDGVEKPVQVAEDQKCSSTGWWLARWIGEGNWAHLWNGNEFEWGE